MMAIARGRSVMAVLPFLVRPLFHTLAASSALCACSRDDHALGDFYVCGFAFGLREERSRPAFARPVLRATSMSFMCQRRFHAGVADSRPGGVGFYLRRPGGNSFDVYSMLTRRHAWALLGHACGASLGEYLLRVY